MEHLMLGSAAAAGALLGTLIASAGDRLYSSPAQMSHQLRARRMLLLAIATAALWAVSELRADDLRQFLLTSLSGTALLTLTLTDFERRLLPNRIMYPCLAAALTLSWVWPHRPPLSGLEGGAVGALVMLTVFLILPGFGFGDVKLAGLIGLILGFPGIVTGLAVGMILGGIGAAWLLLTRRASLQSAMAYGPYLAGGAILEMLVRR